MVRKETTLIRISCDTKSRLVGLAEYDDSMDDVVRKLLECYDEVNGDDY